MKKQFMAKFLLLFILTGLVAACSALLPPYDATAFGRHKVYALVTVVSPKDVEGGDTKTIQGVLAGGKYYFSAQKALDGSIYKIEKALRKHSAFKLYSPAKLKRSRAYRSLRADSKPAGAIIPRGYRFVVSKDKLTSLAKKLNIDGVIVLRVNFGYKFYGNTLGIIGAAGNTHPKIGVDIKFFNREGKMVYQTAGTKIASKGVTSKAQGADPKKLTPQLIKFAPLAVKAIVDRLDNRFNRK